VVRVLVEGDARVAAECRRRLGGSEFEICVCGGPSTRPDGRCPLLTEGRCALIDDADVVIHGLPRDGFGGSVLERLRERYGTKPVAVVSKIPGSDGPECWEVIEATLPGEELRDVVRRLFAGRLRAFRREQRLADGRRVVVRAVAVEDRERLLTFYGALSEASRRYRFFTTDRELTVGRAPVLADVDFKSTYAVVAEAGGAIVADCRFSLTGTETSDFAVVVRDDYQSVGLGRELIELLVGVAEERGIHEFRGSVLLENKRMLRLLRTLGFALEGYDFGIVPVVLNLGAATARP
jgi:ribosomal protein S18 acetylase RimI-like enzyme